MDVNEISSQLKQALQELFAAGSPRPGQILVVGCSTSEICGGAIGHFSSAETGEAVARTLLAELPAYGVDLAAQCCEHLNRALVVEEETAQRYGLEVVSVVPVPKAGGSFAAGTRALMQQPVVVETIQAHWGLDIGDTFIGMHLRPVAVPVRLTVKTVGQAHLTAARCRPKLIGGSRAVYI